MGLLDPGDWQAQWITFNDQTPMEASQKKMVLPPARYYRKSFTTARKLRRATVYASMGFGRVAASQKLSAGSDWTAEHKGSLTATPFMQVGTTGRITDYLDIFMGASKRWQQWTQNREYFDGRVPDDDLDLGGAIQRNSDSQ